MSVEPSYDDRGLVPCVVQDADRGTVLMLAWMNAEALRLARETGFAWLWSRSRQALWKKGETSGHTLAIVEIRVDCDRDAVLVRARPTGPTCHTGATSCFFTRDDGATDDAPTATILDDLELILHARKSATASKSYTKSLFDAGMPKILAKIAEEHGELAAELAADGAARDDAKIVHETADLLFHVMVGLAARDVPLARVLAELARRSGTSGHAEKASRAK
jgi:phosphoribosyl-ATP pyrophosphohydrolase/phosphoribosyl-AMP cyclohydrolase